MSVVSFQGQQVNQLISSRTRALISPSHGARLLTLHVDDVEIIVWPEGSNFSEPAKVRGGNPILFPVIGRHFVDEKIGLAKYSETGDKIFNLPMHGFARDSKFEVVHHDDTTIRMVLKSSPQTHEVYPFDFVFLVTYSLTGPEKSDLTVELRTLNTGTSPMPYYAGHHFYFSIPHNERQKWECSIPCKAWGYQDKIGEIKEREMISSTNSLDNAALIDNFHLQLQGNIAFLQNKETGAKIELDMTSPIPWYNVTTWALSPEHDHYCVEPWLGLPNALHHGQGLRNLQPKEEEFALCTIRYKKTESETPASISESIIAEFSKPERTLKSYL